MVSRHSIQEEEEELGALRNAHAGPSDGPDASRDVLEAFGSDVPDSSAGSQGASAGSDDGGSDDQSYDDEEEDCYEEDPFAQVLLTADGENIPDVLKGIQASIDALTAVLDKQSRILYKIATRLT